MGPRLDKMTNKRYSARSNPKLLSRKAKALARFHIMSYDEWCAPRSARDHANYQKYVEAKDLEFVRLKRKLGVQ